MEKSVSESDSKRENLKNKLVNQLLHNMCMVKWFYTRNWGDVIG